MYYYKDKQNNYYSFKTALWRTKLGKTTNEQGEEVDETYTEEELNAQANYDVLTEEQWNEHIATLHPQPTAEQIAKRNKQKEMAQIKQWLAEHDYIINKHLLGEYTDDDERWTNYLTERAEKLARYNELEGE